jgi:hypothetical protein
MEINIKKYGAIAYNFLYNYILGPIFNVKNALVVTLCQVLQSYFKLCQTVITAGAFIPYAAYSVFQNQSFLQKTHFDKTKEIWQALMENRASRHLIHTAMYLPALPLLILLSPFEAAMAIGFAKNAKPKNKQDQWFAGPNVCWMIYMGVLTSLEALYLKNGYGSTKIYDKDENFVKNLKRALSEESYKNGQYTDIAYSII